MDTETLDRVVTAHIDARYSCRAYLPDPLDRELVRALLGTAGRTPSWCNTQPWSVTVADAPTTDALRSFLAERAARTPVAFDVPEPPGYSGLLDDRRREAGRALLDSVGVERHDREARARQGLLNFRFFDAPHVALVTVDRSVGPYALVDAGAWAVTFQLTATAHGLGCITQAAPAAYSASLRAFFDVPDTHDVVCTVAFGRPDASHPINGFRTSRADLDETVQWRWEQ